MKYLLFFTLVSCTLLAATCDSKGGNGNGGTDSTATEDTTLLPTGGIKPLPLSPEEVEQKLHAQYQNGEIDKCMWKDKATYRCSRNAPDAGSEVYDHQGNRIGRCYYSTRQVDALCEELMDCKTIYRVAKNIWGKPEVPWAGGK